MITVRAPGKLFVAGEYAVVEPGQPAVIVAVDRYLTVHLSEGHGSGSVHSPAYGRLPLRWRHGADGLSIDREHHPYDFVLSALTLVERLRGELGIAPRLSDILIESELDDVSGRKFGLGSSAAVTVATIRALDAFYDLGLTHRQMFQMALLATIRLAPAASGGDVAASTFGGWIEYRAPDRAALRRRMDDMSVTATLQDDAWHPFSVRRLQPPSALRLVVGWTGEPASTERLVDVVQQRKQDPDLGYDRFLADSRTAVGRLVDGLELDDEATALSAIREARALLRRLGRNAGAEIETPLLGVLCDIAERHGAAAKPSGAGGGDCGIALAPDVADLDAMFRRWEAHDIRHLAIGITAAEGSVDA